MVSVFSVLQLTTTLPGLRSAAFKMPHNVWIMLLFTSYLFVRLFPPHFSQSSEKHMSVSQAEF